MHTSTDVRSVLHRQAAILIAASGTVHLSVIDDHTNSLLLMAAFAAMGLTQWTTAAGLWRHHVWADWAALSLQPAIIMTWMLSRTAGIPLITGWGSPEPAGVADVVATALGAAAVILVVASRRVSGESATFVRGSRALRTLTLAFVVLLLVPAVLAPHAHPTADEDTPIGEDGPHTHEADHHHG